MNTKYKPKEIIINFNYLKQKEFVNLIYDLPQRPLNYKPVRVYILFCEFVLEIKLEKKINQFSVSKQLGWNGGFVSGWIILVEKIVHFLKDNIINYTYTAYSLVC